MFGSSYTNHKVFFQKQISPICWDRVFMKGLHLVHCHWYHFLRKLILILPLTLAVKIIGIEIGIDVF